MSARVKDAGLPIAKDMENKRSDKFILIINKWKYLIYFFKLNYTRKTYINYLFFLGIAIILNYKN